MNRSVGKDIQKTPQQFHGIPLPIDDPECEQFPVQFPQRFPQRQTVFFQPLVASGGGIDDHEMFGKLGRNVDEFNPAVRVVQVSFLANKRIVFVRLMRLEHIGIRGVAFQQKHLFSVIKQVVNQGERQLAFAHAAFASAYIKNRRIHVHNSSSGKSGTMKDVLAGAGVCAGVFSRFCAGGASAVSDKNFWIRYAGMMIPSFLSSRLSSFGE